MMHVLSAILGTLGAVALGFGLLCFMPSNDTEERGLTEMLALFLFFPAAAVFFVLAIIAWVL